MLTPKDLTEEQKSALVAAYNAAGGVKVRASSNWREAFRCLVRGGGQSMLAEQKYSGDKPADGQPDHRIFHYAPTDFGEKCARELVSAGVEPADLDGDAVDLKYAGQMTLVDAKGNTYSVRGNKADDGTPATDEDTTGNDDAVGAHRDAPASDDEAKEANDSADTIESLRKERDQLKARVEELQRRNAELKEQQRQYSAFGLHDILQARDKLPDIKPTDRRQLVCLLVDHAGSAACAAGAASPNDAVTTSYVGALHHIGAVVIKALEAEHAARQENKS